MPGGGATDIGSQPAKEEYAKEFEKSTEEILRAGALRMTGSANDKAQSTLSDLFTNSPINLFTHKKAAFTLAEVLITLGIIGVVAALVMPSLHASVEKLILLTQFKNAYSIFSNVVERAKADYGEISSWGLEENFSKAIKSSADVRTTSYAIFQKYIVPYVQNVKFSKEMTFEQLGYKEGIKSKNGEEFTLVSSKTMALLLNNGVLIFPSTLVITDGETGQIIVGEDGEMYFAGIVVLIDVNGAKRPNIIGKDVYIMSIPFAINGKVDLYRPYYFPDSMSPFLKYYDVSRLDILEECNTTGYYCGYLIQQDGWQFKDDYKW